MSVLEKLNAFINSNPQVIPYSALGYRATLATAKTRFPLLGIKEGSTFLGSTSYVASTALISDSWVCGGVTGGNCWGGEANIALEGEAPPQNWALDSFLETYFPAISYLQYKKLAAKISTESFSNHEYYGNSTEYQFYYLTFNDIIEVLETEVA